VVAADGAAEPKEIPMSKTKPKRQGSSRPNTDKANKQGRIVRSGVTRTAGPKTGSKQATRHQHKAPTTRSEPRDSKQTRIIATLRSPSGATIDTMMRATGWQQHSVRGFLAGVVRKKLGLNLVSAAAEGGRVYRIVDAGTKPSASEKVSRAA
jgi:hypothetical protein